MPWAGAWIKSIQGMLIQINQITESPNHRITGTGLTVDSVLLLIVSGLQRGR